MHLQVASYRHLPVTFTCRHNNQDLNYNNILTNQNNKWQNPPLQPNRPLCSRVNRQRRLVVLTTPTILQCYTPLQGYFLVLLLIVRWFNRHHHLKQSTNNRPPCSGRRLVLIIIRWNNLYTKWFCFWRCFVCVVIHCVYVSINLGNTKSITFSWTINYNSTYWFDTVRCVIWWFQVAPAVATSSTFSPPLSHGGQNIRQPQQQPPVVASKTPKRQGIKLNRC